LPQSVIAWDPVDRNALHNFFYNSVSLNYKLSSDDLYSFMYDDLYNIPLHKMKSTQVRNFTGNIVSSSRINFSWDSQSYSTNYYQNQEMGYNLYYKNGTTWQLITTLSNTLNSYIYNNSNISKEYKITSFNSSGESSAPLYINPLTATISFFGVMEIYG
jgi:hypothetical protein